MYNAWLEELCQDDWFINMYRKNLICGSQNQWFVRDARCSQKHLTSWGLNIVFLTIWKCCYKCHLQAMLSFCCLSLFRHSVLVNYSDLDQKHPCAMWFLLHSPSYRKHALNSNISVFLEWGTVLSCRKPALPVWSIHSFFAHRRNLLEGFW